MIIIIMPQLESKRDRCDDWPNNVIQHNQRHSAILMTGDYWIEKRWLCQFTKSFQPCFQSVLNALSWLVFAMRLTNNNQNTILWWLVSCIEGWVDDDEYEEALCMWNVDCGVLMIIGVEWVSWNVSKELLIGDYRMVCGLNDTVRWDWWNNGLLENEWCDNG